MPETAPPAPATESPADYVAPGQPGFVGPLLPPTNPNHSASLPADMNADGLVTPLDALRLTNKYNAAVTAGLVSGEPLGSADGAEQAGGRTCRAGRGPGDTHSWRTRG